MIDLNAAAEELEFPQDTSLRIIVAGTEDVAFQQAAIESILTEEGISYGAVSGDARKGGKFYRFYLKLRFESLESMRRVHTRISQLNGVKAVL